MTSALAYYSLTSIAHSENDSMSAWGIFVHSVVRSSSKRNAVWMLAVYGILLRWSMSHTCSIGLRSGDCDGHGNTSVPLLITQFVTIRATCGRALSWMGWKFWPTAPANGSSIGRRILSMYCWAMWKDEIGSAVNHYSAPHHYRTTSVCVNIPGCQNVSKLLPDENLDEIQILIRRWIKLLPIHLHTSFDVLDTTTVVWRDCLWRELGIKCFLIMKIGFL